MKKENLKLAQDLCNQIENLEAHKQNLLTHLGNSNQVRQIKLYTDLAIHPFVFQNMILDEYAAQPIFEIFTTGYLKEIDGRLETLNKELETL